MKRICSLLFAVALCITATAQQPVFVGPHTAVSDAPAAPQPQLSSTAPSAPLGAPPVVWSEDFGNGFPAGWSIDNPGGLCPWVWSDDGTWGFFNANNGTAADVPLASTTGGNGFLICDIDSANNVNFGQPSGNTYQYISSWVETSPINLSGHTTVLLEFEQLFRFNNSVDLIVEVSNDHFNWTQYTVQGAGVNNVVSNNPDSVSINISAVAGNQPNVWLRFGWDARVYFWAIDDIKIIDAADNDLELTTPFFNGINDSTQTEWYTHVPKRQANFSVLQFGAGFVNNGGSNQTNTAVSAIVTGPLTFNATSPTTTSMAGNADALEITTPTFIPNDFGNYNVSFSVASSVVDDDPTDNSMTRSFSVGDSTYARDLDDYVGNGIYYGPGTPYVMASRFDLHVQDTVSSISILFQANTTPGSVIWASVYDDNFALVATSGQLVLSAANIGTWYNIDLPDTPLPAGQYSVGYSVVTGDVLVGVSPNPLPTPNSTTFANVNGAGWGWTDTYTPFIRLHTKPGSSICDGFIATTTSTNATCGSMDGVASAAGSDGLSPYTYAWSNGANSSIATGLGVGTYTVTVTDANSCIVVVNAEVITTNMPMVATSDITDVVCGTDNNGAITVTVSGGILPVSYSWSNGSTSLTANNLTQGTYTITLTDADGCTSTESFSVGGPLPLTSGSIGTPPTCPGGTNGTATAIIGGGTAPYTYNWLGGGAGTSVSNLASGWAIVAVADANGCTLLDSILVPEAPSFSISLYVNNVSCAEDSALGLITAQPIGGIAPFTYLWGNGTTTNSILDFVPGTYPITVTDGNGCVSSQAASASLDSVILIVADSVVSQSAPPGGGDGGIYISTFGGTAPFTYSWSQGGNTEDVGNLFAGNYTVTITDANGCSSSATYTVGTGTGLREVVAQANDFLIVPNPNNGQFYIKLAEPIHGGLQLDVYSARGRLVLREAHQQAGSTIEVQLSELPAGLYFARLRGSNINQTQKFLLR